MRRICLGFVFVAACATPFNEKIEFDGLPTSAQMPDAKSVVLLYEDTVHFHPVDGKAVADVETRRRVLGLQAGSHITAVSHRYWKDVQEVRDIALRGVSSLEPDKEIVATRSTAVDNPFQGGMAIYSNDREIKLSDPRLGTLPPGSVTELFISTRTFNPREYQFSNFWGGSTPYQLDRFVVKVQAGWSVEWKVFDKGQETTWEPERSALDDGTDVYTWEKRDIPAIVEPTGTVVFSHQPQVWVRLKSWTTADGAGEAFASFAELSRHEFAKAAPKSVVTEEIKALASEILKGQPADPRVRAAELLRWARDEISYCQYTANFDEGFVPHEANKTEDLRYGDCKDKANLYHTLLKADGIPSRLVSLWSHEGMPRRLVFPNLVGNANHVAVLVDLKAGAVFADPTRSNVPFGEISHDEYGAWIMPISEKGDEPTQLPWPKPEDNTDRYRATITVAADGSREIEFNRELSGKTAVDTRRKLDGAVQEGWKSVVSLPGGGAIEELKIENPEGPALPTPVKMTGKAKSAKPDDHVDQWLFSASGFGWRVPGATTARAGSIMNPLVLEDPYTKDYEIKYIYPSADYIRSVPPAQKVDSEFGRVEVSFTKNGRELTVRYREVNRAAHVDNSKFEAFQTWVRDADAAAVTSAVVVKGGA